MAHSFDKKHKKPHHNVQVLADKRPTSLPSPREGTITFSFALFDGAIHWCKKYDDDSHFPGIGTKLRDYERMTWADVLSRDHSVSRGKLIKEAQERLAHLKLDDWDELWRLRFTSTHRLWGIRFKSVFYPIWWDPEHAVCPSLLKHT